MNPALRRDDLLLPYAFFAAFLVHLLVVFFGPSLPRSVARLPERVYEGIRVKVFSSPPAYHAYNPTERVHAPLREKGVAHATSGRRWVEPEEISDLSDFTPVSRTRAAAIAPSMDRLFLGRRPNDALPLPAVAAEPREPGFAPSRYLPAAPDGDLAMRDDAPREPAFGGGDEPAAPASAGPRRASAGEAPRPASGEVEYPGAAAPALAVPRLVPGADVARPAAPPTSAGPTPSDRPDPVPPVEADDLGAPGNRPRRILQKVVPEYPEWAERERIQATVVFDVVVAPSGRVSSATLFRTSGFSSLDRIAQDAVLRWLYEPRPGREEVRRVRIKFRLRGLSDDIE